MGRYMQISEFSIKFERLANQTPSHMFNNRSPFYFGILVLAALCACSHQTEETVNIAMFKAATASTSYDYNLTPQLLTDGRIELSEPAWLKVTTSEGELPRREKEWTLDSGPYSKNTLDGGKNFLEYEWSGQGFTANCVRIVGTVVYKEGASGWSISCQSGSGDLKPVGSIEGDTLPGTPRRPVRVSDPNKQTEDAMYPTRALSFVIPLNGAVDFNKFRIDFEMDGALYWEVNSVDFSTGDSFGISRDTGQYDSQEARGFNVLPAETFTSAWMSADGGPQWVKIDLGENRRISYVNIHWIHKADKTSLQVSEDGEHWRPMRAGKGKGRYVRLKMEGADESGHFMIGEMEVFGPKTEENESGEKPVWRLCRADLVKDSGETISTPGFNSSEWMPAVVPGTVLYSYIAAGAVPDPAIADNNNQISESYFNSDFWYRWETSVKEADKGKNRTLLTFDGINWKAEVFMNGKRLGEIEGAFIQKSFDVTDILKEDNCIAVHVIKPAHFGAVKEKNEESPDFNGGQLGADNPTFHATVGWDWIPTVRGRETGIWNDVHLDFVDDVILRNPLVQTRLAANDTLASMTMSVEVTNLSGNRIDGELEGTIESISFRKPLSLGAGETRTVVFKPSDFPQLRNQRIALWWPNGYGNQILHPATYKFITAGQAPGPQDSRHDLFYLAGVREFTYADAMSDLKMYINGHRFLPKGGNWGFSEFNLRYGADEYDTAARLHKEMNLNMIRNWVGQTGDDEFFDACDKYGIVVWQDFWLANPADGPDPDDEDLFADNAEDFVSRIRRHPSIGLYCGRNEGYPPATLDARLKKLVASLHGDIVYIPNSAADGVSGHGPYRAVEPDSYFGMPARKFHSERGMPAIMNYPSLLKTMTAEHIWPSNDVWGQHDFTRTGAQGDTAFVGMVIRRFGEQAMSSGETFAKYAQYINYDGYRAMYEANNAGGKGLLIWMSHSCWPSLAWQTYDYWFDKTAAYYGVQTACEPVHVQINPVLKSVQVVNYGVGDLKDLKTVITLTSPDGKETYKKEADVELLAEGSRESAIDISDVPDGPVIVELKLFDSNGQALSVNRYMKNYSGGIDTGDYRDVVGKFTYEDPRQ